MFGQLREKVEEAIFGHLYYHKEYWEQVRNKRWEKGGPFSASALANLASITVITQSVSHLFCFHLSCQSSIPLFSSCNV